MTSTSRWKGLYDAVGAAPGTGRSGANEWISVQEVVSLANRSSLDERAEALEILAGERRYYALLFSHEFASNFWKAGELMTFQVPTQTFSRAMADGSVRVVTRKAYTRRSAREDVWRYHLREMAVSDEPLKYIRRFVRVEEELDEVEES